MAKWIDPFERVMDVAYMRDGEHIYTGEALVLACLLKVRKARTKDQEEELKEVMDVYARPKKKRGKRK